MIDVDINGAIRMRIAYLSLFFAVAVSAGPTSPASEPDNAALIYYQAFLLCTDATVDDVPTEVFHAVFQKPDVPHEIRRYVEEHRDAIELIRAASRVRDCDWGMDALLRAPAELRVAQRSRYAAFLMCCNARILAADGDYRAALTDCLAVRRMARHLSEGTVLFLVEPPSVDGYALQCIQQILGLMPPDEETLIFLREEIASLRPVSDNLWLRLDRGFEQYLWQVRAQGTIPPWLRRQSPEDTGKTASESMLPADDDLLERIQEPVSTFLRSVHNTLAGGTPYEKTHAALERLANELDEKASGEPAALTSLFVPPDRVPGLYNLQLAHRSHYNAIVAAVEIYRAYARSGQLPERLPEALPGDPYSGESFEYRRTTKGFILRGRIKPTDQSTPWEYKFRLSGSETEAST